MHRRWLSSGKLDSCVGDLQAKVPLSSKTQANTLLTSSQIKELTFEQIAQLTVAQLNELTPKQILGFNLLQVQGLAAIADKLPGKLAQALGSHVLLTKKGIAKLSQAEIKEIPPVHITKFNTSQLEGVALIRAKHLNWFSPEQNRAYEARRAMIANRMSTRTLLLQEARASVTVTREGAVKLFENTHGIILGQILSQLLNTPEMELQGLITESVDLFGKVIISDFYNPVPDGISASHAADLADLSQDYIDQARVVSEQVTQLLDAMVRVIGSRMSTLIDGYIKGDYSEAARQDRQRAIQDIVLDKGVSIMTALQAEFKFNPERYSKSIDEFYRSREASQAVEKTGKFVARVRSSSEESKETGK